MDGRWIRTIPGLQVMDGRTSDADRMREVMHRYADEMHALRPEIIGATIALHGNGVFIETVTGRRERRPLPSPP